jgi:DNA invertase Pin-like site-specific DNA recombinase
VEQAEKELSLTAQRRSAEEFAARHEAVIDHHYVEPGASGTDIHRAVFNELLGDALRPGSTIAVIIVHHTSRFTRDATHARVVKKELRRAGVRVVSVTQELAEDPMGMLMEGFFECIDQYESEVNGLRTAAAMREAVRQGFYPGGLTPYGFCKVPVEVRTGKKPRYKLAVQPDEAAILRAMYRLYITGSGALKVAEALNALYRGAQRPRLPHAEGKPMGQGRGNPDTPTIGGQWRREVGRSPSRQTAATGQVVHVARRADHRREDVRARERALRAAAPDRVAGSRIDQAARPHRPCTLRALQVELPARDLRQVARRRDLLVLLLQLPKDAACREEGVPGLSRSGRRPGWRCARGDRRRRLYARARTKARAPTPLAANSRGHHCVANFVLRDHDVGRTCALHLIDHVDVHAERIVIVPKVAGRRKALAMLAAIA